MTTNDINEELENFKNIKPEISGNRKVRGTISEEIGKQIVEMSISGFSNSSTVKNLSIPRTTVATILKKYSLEESIYARQRGMGQTL